MKNLKKKVMIWAVSVSVAAGMLTGCAGFDNTAAVATVGEDKIPAGVANFFARYQQYMTETNLQAMLGDDMWSQDMGDGKTYEDNVKDNVMEMLQSYYILEDHMEEYGVALTDEDKQKITKAAAKFDEENVLESKELISAEKEYVERVLTLLTIQKRMRDAMTKDVSTEVTDEEAAQKSMQYIQFPFSSVDENGTSKTLSEEEKEKLKGTVTAFLEGAKAAADLTAYAKEAGYEVQTVTFDAESTAPTPELIKAADALAEGAWTEVVETENALYIAKVTSLLDREATEQEKESIVNTRKSDQFNEVYESWKKETKVKVNEEVWETIDFEKIGVTAKPQEKEE